MLVVDCMGGDIVSVAKTPWRFEISTLRSDEAGTQRRVTSCYNGDFVLEFARPILAAVRVFFRSRSDTALEILALRQQVVVLKRRRPRPALNTLDRLFWTTLRHLWSRWRHVLVIVKPETVVG